MAQERCITYARCSSDDTGKDNMAGQTQLCRDYAEKKGYLIVADLAEDERGAKGSTWDLPALQQALDMARAGQYTVFVVREMDRLARDPGKQYATEKDLESHGVRIEYALYDFPPTPEGKLQKAIHAGFAQYEAAKIAQRTTRKRRELARQGHVICHSHPPYGYEKTTDPTTGKRTLSPLQPQARIVKTIFAYYLEQDMGHEAIATELTKTGIEPPSRNGTRPDWTRSTIQRILTRETYAGTWHYAKSSQEPIPVPVPALVSRATWDRAQAKARTNADYAQRSRKYEYLMARHVVCGDCGSKMRGSARKRKGTTTLYYRCPTLAHAHYRKDCSNGAYYRAEDVDRIVWDTLKEWLTDPEQLRARLERRQTQKDRESQPARERLALIAELIEGDKTKLDRLLDLYLDGTHTRDQFSLREAQLRDRIESLEREQARLEASLQEQVLTDRQIETITEYSRYFVAGMEEAERDYNKRRAIIKQLAVMATLSKSDGKKAMLITCDLLGQEQLVSLAPVGSYTAESNRHGFILTKVVYLQDRRLAQAA